MPGITLSEHEEEPKMAQRTPRLWPALGAVVALSLGQCTWIENARENAAAQALHVPGDYKPLSQCLRGELALQQRNVSYAIDENAKRARVWRQFPDLTTAGLDEFNLLIEQADPDTVAIQPDVAGLAYARYAFLARLQPMLQRCAAVATATQQPG